MRLVMEMRGLLECSGLGGKGEGIKRVHGKEKEGEAGRETICSFWSPSASHRELSSCSESADEVTGGKSHSGRLSSFGEILSDDLLLSSVLLDCAVLDSAAASSPTSVFLEAKERLNDNCSSSHATLLDPAIGVEKRVGPLSIEVEKKGGAAGEQRKERDELTAYHYHHHQSSLLLLEEERKQPDACGACGEGLRLQAARSGTSRVSGQRGGGIERSWCLLCQGGEGSDSEGSADLLSVGKSSFSLSSPEKKEAADIAVPNDGAESGGRSMRRKKERSKKARRKIDKSRKREARKEDEETDLTVLVSKFNAMESRLALRTQREDYGRAHDDVEGQTQGQEKKKTKKDEQQQQLLQRTKRGGAMHAHACPENERGENRHRDEEGRKVSFHQHQATLTASEESGRNVSAARESGAFAHQQGKEEEEKEKEKEIESLLRKSAKLLVELDRALLASSMGYSIKQMRMPAVASPKNDILLGKPLH
uniref:Uncharacterized protein n=1 Tax=Chromera velia CCMP2878 TaxID=1169474 RepID=A0A0G4H965_9ALVE|eukprot:Cvel_5961.t1-p1 / transcript=Cvel_5961.t1 / gene=Cvel_5961 / organism=Chromera_velia_CCMP2878 / gene_product=hypothetical protein / transcript_product=hypothetical protein / location=Cvel_scaffold285:81459-83247(-) / protein_length=479 / sequence_SO=supercontig / SO=protein_coding / is_pseudo=false